MNTEQLYYHKLFEKSVERDPSGVQCVPFVVKDIARKNDKKPATLELAVPDEWSKNIKGNPKLYHTYFLVRVDASLASEFKLEFE